MFNSGMTIITYIAIHIGFSAFLGTQLNSYINAKNQFQPVHTLISFSLILLSPLGISSPWHWAIWGFSIIIIALFFYQPDFLPDHIASFKFGLEYTSASMLLVAIWGLSQGLHFSTTVLSSSAALACGLTLYRSRQFSL